MFSHDPLTGVYKGITPWANSHNTNAAVLWPDRLSSTNNARSGGSSAGRVICSFRPACQRSQAAGTDRLSAAG
jgi:hypothetical protein